jgi:polyisoprenoid-binding protein YceI
MMSMSFLRGAFYAAAASGLLATAACAAPVPPSTPALAGAYSVDPTHVSVTFKVSHFGLSNYTARFTKIDAQVTFDPANPAKSSLVASVDPTSIRTDYPFPEKVDFDKELQSADWFNVAKFATITFKSTKIDVTGANTAKITGDLSFMGVTKPVVLDTVMNAAMDAHPFTKNPAFGISAVGKIDRTAFGLTKYSPFVGNDVTILIEAEFNKK